MPPRAAILSPPPCRAEWDAALSIDDGSFGQRRARAQQQHAMFQHHPPQLAEPFTAAIGRFYCTPRRPFAYFLRVSYRLAMEYPRLSPQQADFHATDRDEHGCSGGGNALLFVARPPSIAPATRTHAARASSLHAVDHGRPDPQLRLGSDELLSKLTDARLRPIFQHGGSRTTRSKRIRQHSLRPNSIPSPRPWLLIPLIFILRRGLGTRRSRSFLNSTFCPRGQRGE